METKRIFVLGNGFDLAHYLPTAYVHFMDAMLVIESHEEDKILRFDDLFKKYLSTGCSDRDKDFFQKTKEIYNTDSLILSSEVTKNLRDELRDNGWFQHFKHHLTDVDTWIDFENEIERLLIEMCNLFEIGFDGKTIGEFNECKGIYFPDYAVNPLKITLHNILGSNKRQINPTFFEGLQLKNTLVSNTLRNFKIIADVHTKAEEKPTLGTIGSYNVEYSQISNKEYEVLIENHSGYSSKVSKRYFKNVIDIGFLKRYSSSYLEFDGAKILSHLLVHLDAFNKIFKMYIELVIN